MKTKILLVEDDETLGFLLKSFLEMREMEVILAPNGAEGLREFNSNDFDCCILDIMMPAIDGFTLAELIRNRDKEIPIIFLTAKSMKEDVVKGFKIGADDYIKKPINEEVLVARIRAVLKRVDKSEAAEQQEFYQIGRYEFNSHEHVLKIEDSERKLTERESELLKLLCESKGDLLSRQYVLTHLWGKNDYFARKSMDVFISRLRKYLSSDKRIKIINVHSSGFVLSLNE